MAKTRNTPPQEIEIKLGVPPNALRQIEDSPSLRGVAGRSRSERLRSTYFDTDDHSLNDRGLSLRVRFDGHRRIQTVKTDAQSSPGLAKRTEWESEVPGDEPDLDLVADTAIAALSKKLKGRLKPVFETRVDRTVFPLNQMGASIEVAIDRGHIISGDRSEDISEVELELKDGDDLERLFELARTVAGAAPVHLEVHSKAERGYALVRGTNGEPERAGKVVLSRKATSSEAFRDIARSCLRQIAANEAAVDRGHPEGVHQMRVGLRRLRAAISLFRPMLAGRQTERTKRQLKWLTDALGPARQLHVFDHRVIKALRDAEFSPTGVDALADDVAQRREAAAVRAKAALASSRYRSLLLDAAEWIDAGDWLTRRDHLSDARRDKCVMEFAPDVLSRRTHQLVKRGKKLRTMDAGRRHKMRIAAKKLRYAAESFASLFRTKRAAQRQAAFVKALRDLQGCLGNLNDVTADGRLAVEIARAADGRRQRRRLEYVAGVAAGYEESQKKVLVRLSCKAHRKFARTPAFWT